MHPTLTRTVLVFVAVAVAWSLSSVGYFGIAPLLGAQIGYNDAPVAYTAYYAAWSFAVFMVFRPFFRDFDPWGQMGRYSLPAVVMIVLFSAFALLVLPVLPPAVWTQSQPPVEFFSANSWYFLPKSLEILFQQILIAVLVHALANLNMSVLRMSALIAVLFGGFHLTLAMSYPNPLYVIRYAVAATVFGAVAPWILLRVPLGFFVTYAIHWTYYAVDITLIHFIFAP